MPDKVYVKLNSKGKAHVGHLSDDGKTVYIPCRPWGWYCDLNIYDVEKVHSIMALSDELPKGEEICKTCRRAKVNGFGNVTYELKTIHNGKMVGKKRMRLSDGAAVVAIETVNVINEISDEFSVVMTRKEE